MLVAKETAVLKAESRLDRSKPGGLAGANVLEALQGVDRHKAQEVEEQHAEGVTLSSPSLRPCNAQAASRRTR